MFTTYLQNHLQQLSGNKFIIIIWISILFSACNIFQQARKPVPVVEEEKKEEVQQEITIVPDTTQAMKDSIAIAKKLEEIEKTKWAKKDSYNIAFILPFSIDAEELYYLMDNENVTTYQPLAAITFYEGALQALDTLRKLHINLEVFTFDVAKDSIKMQKLINSGALDAMDVLIGPIFNECLIPAAQFAKEKEIFLISPLSPSQSITEKNPFYVLMNPTLTTQLQKIASYLQNKRITTNTIIISQEGMALEQNLAEDFKNALQGNMYKSYSGSITLVTSISELQNSIKPGIENYIFIASLDELFVNQLLRSISLASRNENISVIGLSGILNFETVSLDYLESLHFQYPESYYIDRLAPRTLRFKNDFIAKYDAAPDDYAARGFDITLYTGFLLNANGPDIRKGFNSAKPVQYLLGPLRFTEVKNAADSTEYFENSGVTLLRLSNYRFEKVVD